jgi:outer membrane protein insertion porin family
MSGCVGRTTVVLVGILLSGAIGFAQTVAPAAAPKVMVDEVVLQGNRLVPSQKIMSLLKTRPGSDYSHDTIAADLCTLYETKLFANVCSIVQPTGPNKVKISFEVSEFATTIQEVIYVGNDVTRQNIILRQIPFYPVQTMTYPGQARPERPLCETGGQGVVQPAVSVTDPDSDTEFKNVLIRVQEQPTGSLIFGVGVNSDAGLTGSVIHSERKDATRSK